MTGNSPACLDDDVAFIRVGIVILVNDGHPSGAALLLQRHLDGVAETSGMVLHLTNHLGGTAAVYHHLDRRRAIGAERVTE